MTLFVLGIILLVVFLVALIVQFRLEDKDYKRAVRWGGEVCLVVSAIVIMLSVFHYVRPGQIEIAYNLTGGKRELAEGRSPVAPWATIVSYDGTTQVFSFFEDDDSDDIFGAQTSEKDYINVVSTLGAHIDRNRIDEYINLFGEEQIISKKMFRLLKTIARSSIEKVFGVHTTGEVMSQKHLLAEEILVEFKTATADLPIVIDSFTLDDTAAPESYEQAIRDQAALRMAKDAATLQQEVNSAEAEANRIKAEGEAKVAETEANAAAEVAKIRAEADAKVAKIAAENAAEVARIEAEAKAAVRLTEAQAEAEATVKAGEAEAKAIEATGQAYSSNPKLIEIKLAQIQAEVQKAWGERWSGYSFDGMTGFTFADMTDILKGFLNK